MSAAASTPRTLRYLNRESKRAAPVAAASAPIKIKPVAPKPVAYTPQSPPSSPSTSFKDYVLMDKLDSLHPDVANDTKSDAMFDAAFDFAREIETQRREDQQRQRQAEDQWRREVQAHQIQLQLDQSSYFQSACEPEVQQPSYRGGFCMPNGGTSNAKVDKCHAALGSITTQDVANLFGAMKGITTASASASASAAAEPCAC